MAYGLNSISAHQADLFDHCTSIRYVVVSGVNTGYLQSLVFMISYINQ